MLPKSLIQTVLESIQADIRQQTSGSKDLMTAYMLVARISAKIDVILHTEVMTHTTIKEDVKPPKILQIEPVDHRHIDLHTAKLRVKACIEKAVECDTTYIVNTTGYTLPTVREVLTHMENEDEITLSTSGRGLRFRVNAQRFRTDSHGDRK